MSIFHLLFSSLMFPALVSTEFVFSSDLDLTTSNLSTLLVRDAHGQSAQLDGVREGLSGSSLEREFERDWSEPRRTRAERVEDYQRALEREYEDQSGSSFERDDLTRREKLQGCERIVVVNGQRRCLVFDEDAYDADYGNDW